MESSEVDLSQHFSLQIQALKYCYMWFYIPYSVKSIRFWFDIFMKIFLGLALFFIPTSTQILYIIKLLTMGNVEIQEIASIINLVMTELLTSLRLLDLFLRRDILTRLMDQAMRKEFQFHLKPQKAILEKAVQISRKLFWVLLCSCGMDILVHVVVVPGWRKFQVLPLKMNFVFFDVSKEEYFSYIFAYQVSYKPMFLTVYVAIQTLSWAAMSLAISQLDILIYNLKNIKELVDATMTERECDADTAFKLIFKECILHHHSITRYTNTIQEAFGGQLTSALGLSAGIVGTTAIQIFSIESPSKNIIDVVWVLAYLCIFICIMFIDCYFGNSVTIKSLHVSTVIYVCPWIDFPTSLKKNLILFIAKTQRPVVIFAAKFVPVSLETFTKIMKWTYKGFAVLNQMKK